MTARDELLAIPDADLRSGNISLAIIGEMQFASSTRRWWNGWGSLSVAGEEWQGTGDIIRMSDLPSNLSASAEPMSFTISNAFEGMAAIVENAVTEVDGGRVNVSAVLFDTISNQLVPKTSPLSLWTGYMDSLQVSVSRGEDGDLQEIVTLSCEGVFANRKSPPSGKLTDSDQKRRYPGDLGCSRMPIYGNGSYSPTWDV